MIDVPVRVKDALRSGDYRKNYKITVEGADVVSEHKYEEPEIEIYLFYGPLGEYWTTRDILVSLPDDIIKVRIIIDSIVTAFGWDNDGYIAWMAEPQLFEFDWDNNITTITMPDNFRDLSIRGNHVIQNQFIQADTEFTYVKVQGLIDNVIQNDRLVSGSVKFDERMCSDTELKFGLCEGTSVEFQYFDFSSILGKKIYINLDVEYKNADGVFEWYAIPMGWFDVEEISRQASTGIFKVTAYNKLMSKNLDSKINAELISILDNTISKSMPMYELLQLLTEGFAIEKPTGKKDILGSLGPYNEEAHAWGIAQADGMGRLYNGKRYMVGEAVIRLGSGFNRAYYYEFIINTLSDACQNVYMEYLQRTGNPLVWCDETQYPITLSAYINGNYEYSKHFGGYFKITTAGGDIEYPLNRSRQQYDTDFMNNVDNLYIYVPTYIYDELLHEPARSQDINNHNYPSCISMDDYIMGYVTRYREIENMGITMSLALIHGNTLYAFQQISETPADEVIITEAQIASISDDITLRDMQSAVYELNCQYGKLDRVTDLFAGIELNNGGLYPRDNLYPADNLYPQGTAEAGYPSMYSKLWADEGNIRSFRYLIITYKTTETIEGQTQEVEKTLQRTVNADGTDNYNMSDNWLFRNLIWTSQQVGAYADAMVTKMQNIRWFPFEMWCAGLPFLEAGDEIEIQMREGTYKSYVLRRTLSGIQNLQDEMINGTLDIF